MSQLAGVFYFDSKPISRADKAAARRCFDRRHSAGIEVYESPGVLLMTSLGQLEPRPRVRPVSAGGNVCSWDGRLDNPEDRPGNHTASDLALAAYEARGIAGLVDLVGDWSLVIWDATTRTIVLASDYAGVRPLYYCRTAGRLLWSSSLMHLAEWSGADGLDDEYVAAFLTRGIVAERTPYPGVFSVPAGSAVAVTEGRLSTQRFWSFPSNQTRYERDEDYEEQLRALFREAVQVRLKTPSPAAAELSGGLDSSSVVCFAHHLIASGQAPAPSLTSFSYCGGGSTDEPYIRLVEEFCGITGTHFDIAAHPFVSPEHVGASAPAFWEPRLIEVSRRMASAGSAALLTGQMGDLVMGNWLDDSEQVADLLKQRKFSAAVREAFAWSHSLRVPVHSILWRAVRSSVFSWSPAANRDLSSGSSDEQTHGDSLTSRFRTSFKPQLTPQAPPANASSAYRKRFWSLSAMLSGRVLQCPERLHHVDYTHPYAHRPLVEFMMTVPPGAVCRPGTPRRLMRRAFAGFVPGGILKRRSKATYDGVFREAMLPLATALLDSRLPLHLVERGYIDPVSLRNRLTLFREGLDCNASQLRYVILLEFWLRNRAAQAAPPVTVPDDSEPILCNR